MRGYHVRIRVTIQRPPTTTTTSTPTTKTSPAWTPNTFVPKSIFESLPVHAPRKTSKNKPILGSKRRDYRYGPIRIDWLDLNIKEPKAGVGPGTMDGAPAPNPVGLTGKERDVRNRGQIVLTLS